MSKKSIEKNAAAAGTFLLGKKTPIHRMGFGAMRLTGPNIWGEHKDPQGAAKVLQKAIELGVNFIDTADSYGPEISENVIAKTLYPYPSDLVIATKGGLVRPGADMWVPLGRPEYLIQCVEMSLRRLRIDTIDLYQLHSIDPRVPLEESLEALKIMQKQGKIRYIGLSNVTVSEIERAQKIVPIVSIQNQYNLIHRQAEDVIRYCEKHHLAFIPWFPIGNGELARSAGVLEKIAQEKQITTAQLALAWLLNHSEVMIPIPGTANIKHLEENIAAASLELSQTDMELLEKSRSI